nr:MAG TPA: hypothetical protein [Caudoviricetes sp.]
MNLKKLSRSLFVSLPVVSTDFAFKSSKHSSVSPFVAS